MSSVVEEPVVEGSVVEAPAELTDPELPFDFIPLPEVGGGERTRRRRERLRRRRQRRAIVGGGLAAVVVLVVLISGTHHRSRAAPGHAAKGAAAPVTVAPVVLVQTGPGSRAVSIVVLVPAGADQGQKGGSLVLVPPGTMTEVASLGLEPVGNALALGGPERLKGALQNLFGVSLGSVSVVDDAGLAALVRPAGPLRVDVPERVEQIVGNGQVQVLFEAGPSIVAPDRVPLMLSARGRGSDLARLARHQALFDAWLARIHAVPAVLGPVGPAPLHAALDVLARGQVQTRVVPVEQLGLADDGTEQYKVQQPDLEAMVAGAFPSQPRPVGARPQVQILNGTGVLELAEKVAARLVPAGVEVKLTGNAGNFDYTETQIVFYDARNQPVAERVQRALGVGRLVLSRRPLDVVDVTVIVGKDFHSG